MTTISKFTFIALVAVVTAGCATLKVSSYVERGTDFTQFRTYDWGPADALPTGDPRLDEDPFFLDHFEGAVEIAMANKGYRLAETGPPDLLIHYHAAITPRIDINRLDRERGYCYDGDCRVRTIDSETGTLLVDVVDTRTHKLIWRGWAQHGVADILNNRDRMETRINEAVARMLAQLPSAQMGAN
jgi:hypothetical protein